MIGKSLNNKITWEKNTIVMPSWQIWHLYISRLCSIYAMIPQILLFFVYLCPQYVVSSSAPRLFVACWFSSSEFSSSLHSDNHDGNVKFSKRTLMFISSQIPCYVSLLNPSIYPCLVLSPLFLLDSSNFSGFSLFAHAFIYYFYLLRLWSW